MSSSKEIRLKELKQESYILFSRNEAPGLFDQIITACGREKFTPSITSQPHTMQTLLTEVASGLGISVAPGCIRQLYTKGCSFIPIKNLKPSIQTVLYSRSDVPSPTAEAFIKLAEKSTPMIRTIMEK